ncbi:hypothetical protein QBZ16_000954 [Prototheca wickerhamii]|uniref:SCP2 domain-containing protein n=1 Tax=Prototheca wickerhamii TaxID=3111 RepID=A0AAD9IDY4_PROWI|nr:hypothetical protein QBZ16_000954 [Prototheca wickerhamii]
MANELLESLAKRLEAEPELRESLCNDIKAIVVFKIDKDEWTLDLRPGKGSLKKGPSADKVNLTLTVNSANFVQLVKGKLGAQQAFFMRKLKLQGSMGLAMKLQPILDAANEPSAKL